MGHPVAVACPRDAADRRKQDALDRMEDQRRRRAGEPPLFDYAFAPAYVTHPAPRGGPRDPTPAELAQHEADNRETAARFRDEELVRRNNIAAADARNLRYKEEDEAEEEERRRRTADREARRLTPAARGSTGVMGGFGRGANFHRVR